MSILELPENIMEKIVGHLREPDFRATEESSQTCLEESFSSISTDPRDLFNFVRTCKKLYSGHYMHSSETEYLKTFNAPFEKLFAKKQQAPLVPNSSAASIPIIQTDPTEHLSKLKISVPTTGFIDDKVEGHNLNNSSAYFIGEWHILGPSKPHQVLTIAQQELIHKLGRNWIAMFKSDRCPLRKPDKKRQESLKVMENLQDFVVAVLCCHLWTETGRFTILCRTRLNDFMLLHGIDGLWKEHESYPFVVFGTKLFGSAESIYSSLVMGDYRSITETSPHPLWTGFGSDM